MSVRCQQHALKDLRQSLPKKRVQLAPAHALARHLVTVVLSIFRGTVVEDPTYPPILTLSKCVVEALSSPDFLSAPRARIICRHPMRCLLVALEHGSRLCRQQPLGLIRDQPSCVLQRRTRSTQRAHLREPGLGTVQASFTIAIHSQVDGKLQEVLFTEGQQVRQGTGPRRQGAGAALQQGIGVRLAGPGVVRSPGGRCLHRQALTAPSRWKRPPPCTSLRGRRGPPNNRERTAVPTGEIQPRSEI